MPQLKHLSCTVHWADTTAPFQEYGTAYGDGVVESYIVVPNKPQPFTIRLKSLSYIHEGLAMVVFIDGHYQANRNRVNLKPAAKKVPLNQTQVDFLLRQREKPIGEGIYMGRGWRFDNHNIGKYYTNIIYTTVLTETVEDLPEGVKESHFDLLGTIEVLVLRCRARIPEEFEESGSSSGADTDALGEKGERFVVEDGGNNKTKPSNKDGVDESVSGVSGTLAFGSDGTGDYRDNQDLDGPGGPPVFPGRDPWEYPAIPHARHRSQSQSTRPPISYSGSSHTFRKQHASPHSFQQPSSQKQVRFDLGASTGTNTAQPSTPNHSRPSSYERTRPPVYYPPQIDHHYNGYPSPWHHQPWTVPGPVPVDPKPYQPQYAPQYQQPPQPWSMNYDYLAPSDPPSSTASRPPPPNATHPYQTPYLQPGIPAYASQQHQYPWTFQQPPHFIYNPFYQHPGHAWPMKPRPNVANPNSNSNQNPSPATVIDSSNNSSNNWDGQQQNGTSNQGNNNGSATWETGTQNNNIGDWSNDQANTTATSANSDNNNTIDWNSNGQAADNINGGWSGDNNGWSNQNGNDNQNNSNQDWNNGTAENNKPDSNEGKSGEEDATASARALYGPHGQYYTYTPKGPDEPEADAEEEPRYDVPRKIATVTGSTKQVLPGSGFMYWKKRRAPEYIDTMEEPYARFVFKYRTKDQLEKEIGVKLEVEPTGDEVIQELQGLEKQALIEMLMRAKSALGGKVPSPNLKPATAESGKGDHPVPVDPPNHPFLAYKLPELRKAMADITNQTTSQRGSNAGGGGGGSGQDDAWATNNNDSSNWDNGNGTAQNATWNTGNASQNTNVNWNRSWDGTSEQQAVHNRNSNQTADWSQPGIQPGGQGNDRLAGSSSVRQGMTGDTARNMTGADQNWAKASQSGSVSSSPSTLPLDPSYLAGSNSNTNAGGHEYGSIPQGQSGPPGSTW